MQQPKHRGTIRCMANQLGILISNLSIVKKNDQRAFDLVNDELGKTPMLVLYDPKRETTVSAHASSYGLGAVLRQRTYDALRSMAYVSRAMTPTDQRYS